MRVHLESAIFGALFYMQNSRVCGCPEIDFSILLEHTGFEPVTSTLPVWRAPNCANAPNKSLNNKDTVKTTVSLLYHAVAKKQFFFRYWMGSKSAAPCLHRGQMKSSGSVSPS